MTAPSPFPPLAPWDWQPAQPMRLERPVGLLRLRGPDTLRFLHGQSSQALADATPGERRLTCCLNATARLLALAEVLVTGDGAWLVITAGDAPAVRAALDRVLFPADRVELGPLLAARLVTPVGPADPAAPLPEIPAGTWQPLAEGEGLQLGESVLITAEEVLPRWLAGRGALAAAEAERWRLQRGEPGVPGEINGEVNPFEVGVADRVSLSKGCYVGQETLARLATYDGVKQQVRRWCWPGGGPPSQEAGGAAPAAGDTLWAADGHRGGRITSALALADGSHIGLALVRRSALEEDRLRAGDTEGAPWLTLSLPEAFVPPPVGAGGG